METNFFGTKEAPKEKNKKQTNKQTKKWHCWRKGSTTIIHTNRYWVGNKSLWYKGGFEREKQNKTKRTKNDILGERGLLQ